MATFIDSIVALLGYKLEGEADLKKFQKGLDDLEKKAYNVGKAISTTAALAGGALSIAFGALGKSVIDTSAQFEKFEATLEILEKSSSKAKESMKWVQQFAARTPYDVAGVTEAFIKLKSYGLDPVNGLLETLGDTASARGVPLNQAIEAMADAATGEFQRLKELTGMTAKQTKDQVVFTWSEGGQQVSKTIKNTRDDILKFIEEDLKKKFGGAMLKQSKTWTGMMSNLADSWSDFMRRIGQAGFFDAVKARLQSVLDAIARWTEDGTIDRAAKSLSDFFTTISDGAATVFDRFGTHIGYINQNWEKFSPYVKAAAIAIGLLIAAAHPMIAGFMLLGLVLDDVLTDLEGGDSIIGDFRKWLMDLIPASEEVKKTLANLAMWISGGLMAAFVLAPKTMTGIVLNIIGAFVKTFASLFITGIMALAPALTTAFTALFALLSNPVGWAIILAGVAAALIAYFWEDLKKLWAKMDFPQLGADLGKGILDGLKRMGRDITDWFMGLFPEVVQRWLGGGSGSLTGGSGSNGQAGSAGSDNLGVNGPARRYRDRTQYGNGGGTNPRGRVPLNSADEGELRAAITKTANDIGASPEDLATLMSFETGGTFNKDIQGGAGGRYRGLIQFGPAEQKMYGIRPGMSITEQVEAAGQFFKDRGYKKGMTGEQLYATVNAGNPYKVNASDAGNGGTWGTVTDKWRLQMGPHRANARKLLRPAAQTEPAQGSADPGARWRQGPNGLGSPSPSASGGSNSNVSVNAPISVTVKSVEEANKVSAEGVKSATTKGLKPAMIQ